MAKRDKPKGPPHAFHYDGEEADAAPFKIRTVDHLLRLLYDRLLDNATNGYPRPWPAPETLERGKYILRISEVERMENGWPVVHVDQEEEGWRSREQYTRDVVVHATVQQGRDADKLEVWIAMDIPAGEIIILWRVHP